jgi:hypothetical protein
LPIEYLTMNTWRFKNLLGAALALMLCSCASSDRQTHRASATSSPASGHGLHSERLRRIMTGMAIESNKTWPQEIASERAADAEMERELRFDQAEQLAGALATAAGQIPQAIEGVELADPQRRQFLRNVDRLRTLAVDLESLARARDFRRMHDTLNSIRTTCNSCHSQFRELIGPVSLPPRAL